MASVNDDKQDFLDKLKDPIGYEIKKGLAKFEAKLSEHDFGYATDNVDGLHIITTGSDDQKALANADEYFKYCFRDLASHCHTSKIRSGSDSSARTYYISQHSLSWGKMTLSYKGTSTHESGYFYCPYVPHD